MSEDMLQLSQEQLVQEWEHTLPEIVNQSGSVKIVADEADPKALRIHVAVAGHTNYTFDFKCTYVDSREVKVELVDVEEDGQHVDEHTEIIQTLIEDYVRHIHECAQVLQRVTRV